MEQLSRKLFKNILIIKPSSLGDVVRCLPIYHGLRAKFPHARISWLVRPDCAALLEELSPLEIILFDRKHYGKIGTSPAATFDFIRFVIQLAKRRFDLVLDLQGLFRSGFFSLCTGAPVRIGFANAREFASCFYTHRVNSPRQKEHIVDSCWRFAEMLGFQDVEKSFDLPVNPTVKAGAEKLLHTHSVDGNRAYIVLLPGGTAEAKCWPAERFAELAQYIQKRYDITVIVLGRGADERRRGDKIIMAAPLRSVNLVDQTTLQQTIELLRSARIVVGNDSGPLHITAALNTPLVGIYGPTDPVIVGPYRQESNVIRSGNSTSSQQRYSPFDIHRIDRVTNDMVRKKLDDLLN